MIKCIVSLIYFALVKFCVIAVEINATAQLKLFSTLYGNYSVTKSLFNETGLYYVYPWGIDYYWRFPLDNSTCKDTGLQHYMMENSGYNVQSFMIVYN